MPQKIPILLQMGIIKKESLIPAIAIIFLNKAAASTVDMEGMAVPVLLL